MSFLEKIKREFLNSIEFKGAEGRRRELTRWDIAFTAIILSLILAAGFVLLYLGIIKP